MYFKEKDCLTKTGNGKAIILSTRAAFYLSASVFQPESNATNQQIVNDTENKDFASLSRAYKLTSLQIPSGMEVDRSSPHFQEQVGWGPW